MSTSPVTRLKNPCANRLALGLRHVEWCPATTCMVHVCWRHNPVLWHENMLNIGWRYSARKIILSVRSGCEIRQALSRIVLYNPTPSFMWRELQLVTIFSLALGAFLAGMGFYIYILPLWDKWPTIPTKNSWLFILTAPWLGFPTRLATSFLGRLSWQECWQMVGVSTAFCLGTHLSACGFLGFMQNRTRQLIIHLAIEIGLRSLIFLCLVNRQGLLTCYLTSAMSWMNINVVFEWLFNL